MQQRRFWIGTWQTRASYAFSQYRKTQQWVGLETACLERDGYRCARCRSEKRVSVWVRKWPENGGSYADIGLGDVEALCSVCIRKVDGRRSGESNSDYNRRKGKVEDLGVGGVAENGKVIRQVRTT